MLPPLRTRTPVGFLCTVLALAIWATPAAPAAAQTPEEGDRPGLGITGFTAPGGQGAGVSTVLPGMGAAEAGLRTGDIIVEVEGNEIDSIEALSEEIRSYEPGDTVSITYLRDGEEETVEVTLEALPATPEGGLGPFFEEEPFFGQPEPDRDRGRQPREDEDDDVDLFPIVFVFGVLISGFLATLTILKLKERKRGSGQGGGSPLEVARMRYASGEISRDQFLLVAADLGEPSPEGKTESRDAGATDGASRQEGNEPSDEGEKK